MKAISVDRLFFGRHGHFSVVAKIAFRHDVSARNIGSLIVISHKLLSVLLRSDYQEIVLVFNRQFCFCKNDNLS